MGYFTLRSARMAGVGAAGLCTAGLMLGAGPVQPPGPQVKTSPAQAGVQFQVTSVNATISMSFAEPGGSIERMEGQLHVMGKFTRAAGAEAEIAIFPWRMVITSALDDQERELLGPGQAERPDQQWTRQALAQHVYQALQNRQNEHHNVQDWLRGLKVRPDRVAAIRGRAEAMIGGRITRVPVELRATEEGIQLTPGVVLLITEVSATPARAVVDFEVRTRRNRGGDGPGPGFEPVFGGLALKDASGQVMMLLRQGQEIEARDEYLFLARGQGVPKEYLERVKTAEAWVVDEFRPVVVEFEVTGLGGEVIAEPARPKEGKGKAGGGGGVSGPG